VQDRLTIMHITGETIVFSDSLSFIQAIYIAPFQVHYYTEALPRQHGYGVGVSRRSATDNSGLRLALGTYLAA